MQVHIGFRVTSSSRQQQAAAGRAGSGGVQVDSRDVYSDEDSLGTVVGPLPPSAVTTRGTLAAAVTACGTLAAEVVILAVAVTTLATVVRRRLAP